MTSVDGSSISERIRNLPIGGTDFFPGANRNTIKVLASRIGTEIGAIFRTNPGKDAAGADGVWISRFN